MKFTFSLLNMSDALYGVTISAKTWNTACNDFNRRHHHAPQMSRRQRLRLNELQRRRIKELEARIQRLTAELQANQSGRYRLGATEYEARTLAATRSKLEAELQEAKQQLFKITNS